MMFENTGLLLLALLLGVAVAFLILIREQRRNKRFDLTDLVTGENGRVSLSKFAQCGAFFISTWGFIYLVIIEKLSESYFGLYMMSWAGANLVNKALSKNDQSVQNPISASAVSNDKDSS